MHDLKQHEKEILFWLHVLAGPRGTRSAYVILRTLSLVWLRNWGSVEQDETAGWVHEAVMQELQTLH
jgi:hypothetical protein